MTKNPIRIAMWSGPRNISTAMMRSFENRADCCVVDEPFYASYLYLTGIEHPMREEILGCHETDWNQVARRITGPPPEDCRIFYQKHMTHHMIPPIGRGWMAACRHAFLIRQPERVLASYSRKRATVTADDIGFAQQAALFDETSAITGKPAPVVDADMLLADPAGMIASLCEALEIPFDPAMLRWPAGPRASDGIWANHWYDAVRKSTGFQPASPRPALDDPALISIADRARPHYERLAKWMIGPDDPLIPDEPAA